MKKILGIIVIITLLAGFNLFSSPITAKADVIQPDECYPAVLMFRGSGENKVSDSVGGSTKTYKDSHKNAIIQTNGYEGERIEKLLSNFAEKTDPLNTVSRTRFIGVDYPALPVFPSFDYNETQFSLDKMFIFNATMMLHYLQYQDSYNEGALRAVNIIKDDMRRGCDTQYTFIGYSQGAISARIASSLLDNDTDKIVSTYVIGDPYQKKDGVYSDEQKSPANTGFAGTGSMRNSPYAETEYKFLLPNDLVNDYEGTYINMKYTDKVFYRNDDFVSRSLCHHKDFICTSHWLGLFDDFEQHSNYFQEKNEESLPDTAGDVDLEYEVSAFDSQVQALANSAQSNPRARTLTKTPSVSTSSTVYNLANARVDDKCSWDEGNNGSYEKLNIPCDPYEYKSSTNKDKLKLRVTDSFGTDYFFETDEKVFQAKQLEDILYLDPNQWYQFQSYDGKCIQWDTLPEEEIWDDAWNIDAVNCKDINNTTKAEDSLQAFKAKSVANDNYNRRIVGGYDDDYSWGRDHLYDDGEDGSTEYLAVQKNTTQDYYFKPTLSSLQNGKAYYSFSHDDECLTKVGANYGYSNLIMRTCNKNDTKQLFAPIKVEGVFGAESIERDTIPPSAPSGVRTEIHGIIGTIHWNKIFDRGIETDYEVYLYNPDTKEDELVHSSYSSGENEYSFSLDEIPINGKNIYTIRSIDRAGHTSSVMYTILPQSLDIYSPNKPALVSINSESTMVTLRLPKYDTSLIRGVQVFDNKEYVGTFTGSATKTTNINLDVTPNTTHSYYYKYEISNDITSEKSTNLKVVVP